MICYLSLNFRPKSRDLAILLACHIRLVSVIISSSKPNLRDVLSSSTKPNNSWRFSLCSELHGLCKYRERRGSLHFPLQLLSLEGIDRSTLYQNPPVYRLVRISLMSPSKGLQGMAKPEQSIHRLRFTMNKMLRRLHLLG